MSERRFTCEGTIFSTRKVRDDPQCERGAELRGRNVFFGGGWDVQGDPQCEGAGCASGYRCLVVPLSRGLVVPSSQKRVGR